MIARYAMVPDQYGSTADRYASFSFTPTAALAFSRNKDALTDDLIPIDSGKFGEKRNNRSRDAGTVPSAPINTSHKPVEPSSNVSSIFPDDSRL
jgi:hypothetical protein